MYHFMEEVKRELDSVNFLLDKIEEMNLKDHAGSLYCRSHNGTPVYTLRKSEMKDGKRYQTRIKLGDQNDPRVVEIIQTRYYSKMRTVLLKNKRILEKLLINYKDYSPDSLTALLPAAFREPPIDNLEDSRQLAGKEWANEAYQQNPKIYPASPNKAIDGTYVRSKSEVIIFNMLLFYNIPFRYEVRMVYVGEDNLKEIRYPDFVFKLADGSELHWEHFGMLTDEDYFKNSFIKKLKLYHQNGFTLGDNLIVTCDTKSNTINTQMIDLIIRGIIMPLL